MCQWISLDRSYQADGPVGAAKFPEVIIDVCFACLTVRCQVGKIVSTKIKLEWFEGVFDIRLDIVWNDFDQVAYAYARKSIVGRKQKELVRLYNAWISEQIVESADEQE